MKVSFYERYGCIYTTQKGMEIQKLFVEDLGLHLKNLSYKKENLFKTLVEIQILLLRISVQSNIKTLKIPINLLNLRKEV